MSYSVLFVCMGNICRSPAAEGIFQALVNTAGLQDQIQCDSAGTLGYHAGELADSRMRQAASKRGFTLTSRARKVNAADLQSFDLVIAMDLDNYAYLEELQQKIDGSAQLSLMCDYAKHSDRKEVPDPYYGGAKGFETVLDLLEDSCAGLLQKIQEQISL